MTFPFLLLVAALAACCIVRGRRRIGAALGALFVILSAAIGCGPVPQWLLTSLQAPYAVRPTPAWSARNAIVLLGAGDERIPETGRVEPGTFAYCRLTTAVALYRACRLTAADCKIVASGGDAQRLGAPEAAVYRAALIDVGVAATDVLTEPDSLNTWQNAQFCSALLRRYRADRVALVSSGIHLRRSLLYFAHFGVRPVAVRAEYLRAIPSLLPLAYNFAVTDFALHEFVGIARYHVYNALGRNAAAMPGFAHEALHE